MSQQINIFEILYDDYKITKPIRMIELFAGIGATNLALKYIGAEYESYKICEWAVKSIQAYKDIHFKDDTKNYSEGLSRDEVVEFLHRKGISANYNEPMSLKQIERLKEETLRTIYNNIQATHNLVNISQVKGKDLEIVEKDKYEYFMTYSFPCQDISLAGGTKGFKKGSGTRSGLLWEVERILLELGELNQLPQVLLMENVPQIHSQENKDDFQLWQKALEKLGYTSYWQDLIGTDYGIPQSRNRTFMISLLGQYNYTFPKAMPLNLKLKDLLEEEVDEKYYLSDKTIGQIFNWNSYQNPLDSVLGQESISPTITTRIAESQDGGINASMKLYCNELNETTNLRTYNKSLQETLEKNNIDDTCYIDTYNKTIHKDKSGTITTGVSFRNNTFIAEKTSIPIKNNTKKGYLLAEEGDGVDISGRMEYHRGTVQKGISQTITTAGGENVGVVVEDKYLGIYDVKESNTFRPTIESRVHLDSPASKTLTCKENSCCIIERERVDYESANSHQENAIVYKVSQEKILKTLKQIKATHLFII